MAVITAAPGRRSVRTHGRLLAAGGAITLGLLAAPLALGTAHAVAAVVTPGSLSGVDCTSASACVAVGSYGPSGNTLTLAETWNGTTWTIVASPNAAGGSDDQLSGVSCTSSTSCVAVGAYSNGDGYRPLAETWNGSTWTIQPVPLPSGALAGTLVGVSCPAISSCTAVGDYADSGNQNVSLAEGWNGSSFSTETVPAPSGATTNTLTAVSCGPAPAVTCEAVGFYYVPGPQVAMVLAERWSGTAWTVQTTPIPNDASGGAYPGGLSCGSPTGCTSVGESLNGSGNTGSGWAQRWNGKSWRDQTTKDPTGAVFSILSGVSCSAAPSTACTAVGYYGNGSAFLAFAEAWNGQRWAPQRTPEPKGSTSGGLAGVSCTSPPGSCIAVGSVTNSSGVQVTLAEGWNGTKWTIEKTPNP